jgi:macrolide transport system ATP-binding/permease protein
MKLLFFFVEAFLNSTDYYPLLSYKEGFFMLLIEGSNIEKYFGDRLVIDIKDLKIYSEDRIGIVGINGAGKSTLLNILTEKTSLDSGWVRVNCKYSYITQLEKCEDGKITEELASRFGIASTWQEHMSGGEKTRFKLAHSLLEKADLILADEPTSNLDLEGIELVEKAFLEHKGALLVISHDREFLDKLCNKIIELDQGKIKSYKGNYTQYAIQKKLEFERAQFEFDSYRDEKRRLEQLKVETKEKARGIRNAPRRMGNSEARLHKMGNQRAKASLDRAVKNVEARIEHLEVKEKPKTVENIKLDTLSNGKLHSKIIIRGRNINKSFDKKVLFKEAEFNLYNGAKIAVLGANGSGKSTLIKTIVNNSCKEITMAKGANIGYFSQDFDTLKEEKSIIENVMESSIYDETFARILLARLLFKREDIYKKVGVLSGGERVKVAFAAMFLQDINLLILDEPTNYLDVYSLEVVEEALKQYDRTLLFVSHDRRFVRSVADTLMIIENKKINVFNGSYEEYIISKEKKQCTKIEDCTQKLMVLENRLSEVLSRISMPSKNDDVEALDKEYIEILKEVRVLKSKLK